MAKKVNVKRLKSDIWTRLSELEERTSIGSSASRTSRKSSLLSDADGEGNIIFEVKRLLEGSRRGYLVCHYMSFSPT